MNSKVFQRIFGIAFYAIAAVFLVLYTQSLDWASLGSLEVNFLWLGIASVLGLATRFLFARIWLFFLAQSGEVRSADRAELYLVYAKSWLGRYIPGSVTWVVGKVVFATKLGISKSRLAVSSFLEAVLQLLTVLLTATLLLVLDPRTSEFAGQWIWLLLAAAIVGIVFVLPPVFRAWATLAYRLVRKSELDGSLVLGSKALLQGFMLFVLSSLLSGLALFFVALAVVPDLGFENMLFILAASNLASAISMVAVFAPAGIGVREAVQIAALSIVMSPAEALVVALSMRLVSLVWDLMFPALARLRKTAR
jgi:uncharacterized membrane protein YbhN (UPF0104 family)